MVKPAQASSHKLRWSLFRVIAQSNKQIGDEVIELRNSTLGA